MPSGPDSNAWLPGDGGVDARAPARSTLLGNDRLPCKKTTSFVCSRQSRGQGGARCRQTCHSQDRSPHRQDLHPVNRSASVAAFNALGGIPSPFFLLTHNVNKKDPDRSKRSLLAIFFSRLSIGQPARIASGRIGIELPPAGGPRIAPRRRKGSGRTKTYTYPVTSNGSGLWSCTAAVL